MAPLLSAVESNSNALQEQHRDIASFIFHQWGEACYFTIQGLALQTVRSCQKVARVHLKFVFCIHSPVAAAVSQQEVDCGIGADGAHLGVFGLPN